MSLRSDAIAAAANAKLYGVVLGAIDLVRNIFVRPLPYKNFIDHTMFLLDAHLTGTLGRQGSPAVLGSLCSQLEKAGQPYVTVLLSEIFPQKLASFKEVEAWIQVRDCLCHLPSHCLHYPAPGGSSSAFPSSCRLPAHGCPLTGAALMLGRC